MSRLKRRTFTTDDLLRMQEGPERKRLRRDLDTEGTPDTEDVRSEDSVTAKPVNSDSESEDDNSQHEPQRSSEADCEMEDRFSSSRLSFLPRAAKMPHLHTSKPAISPARPSTFASLGISSALLSALSKMSIRVPTEIQAICIPPLLQGESHDSS